MYTSARREDVYAALKEDIRQRGVLLPIEKDEDGNTLDGRHREQFDMLSRPTAETAAGRTPFKVRRAESVAAGVPVEN